MSRISVRGMAVASATAVTAVGAVVGISGTGVSASADAQTVDEASTTRLLAVPVASQAEELSTGIQQQADAQTAAYDEAQRVAAEEAARVKAEAEAKAKAAAEKAEAERREKEAAEKAEAERREKAAIASRSSNRVAVGQVATAAQAKAIAKSMMSATQYQCFSNIVERESGWRVTAQNPSSGAYGLVQALPATKMASAGSDWRTSAQTQIKWGLNYMNDRYGSPCDAWSFWQKNHWY